MLGKRIQVSDGFGTTPGRHDDRSATKSLDWDRRTRITAAPQPRPRKCAWGWTAALVRCRKRRGGTPSGERAALQREPHPPVRSLQIRVWRRSASCSFYEAKDYWNGSVRYSPFSRAAPIVTHPADPPRMSS